MYATGKLSANTTKANLTGARNPLAFCSKHPKCDISEEIMKEKKKTKCTKYSQFIFEIWPVLLNTP